MILCQYVFSCEVNHIGCVMVSMLASSAVDRGFEARSGLTKVHYSYLLLLR
jgi:hypothetical protein